jgi:replicative DNA helicase
MIEETAALTHHRTAGEGEGIKRDNPASLAMIVVDYLQLMASAAKTQSERTQEIGDISRG